MSLLVSQLRPRDYSLFTKRNVFSYSLLLIPYFLMWSYYRYARYWIPAKATNRQPTTKHRQSSTYHYFFLLIFYICTVSHFIPLLREERVVVGSSFVSFSIKMRLFHINSHISSGFLLKNKISKCNSTLPPRCCYHCDNQWIMRGGITGGIRVELHVIPPIFHL